MELTEESPKDGGAKFNANFGNLLIPKGIGMGKDTFKPSKLDSARSNPSIGKRKTS